MFLPDRIRNVNDEGVLALYMLKLAALNGSNRVTLENPFLKKWFNLDRIYENKAMELGIKLQKIFPVTKVSTDDKERNILLCYLKDGIAYKEVKNTSIKNVPNLDDIEKELGFSSLLVSVKNA